MGESAVGAALIRIADEPPGLRSKQSPAGRSGPVRRRDLAGFACGKLSASRTGTLIPCGIRASPTGGGRRADVGAAPYGVLLLPIAYSPIAYCLLPIAYCLILHFAFRPLLPFVEAYAMMEKRRRGP